MQQPIEHLLAAAVTAIQDGQLNRRNMRREFITEDELRSHLRQEGASWTALKAMARLACQNGPRDAGVEGASRSPSR